MPYEWNTPAGAPTETLHLWAHQSLPARGYVWFIGATFLMILIPLIPLIGSVVAWGLIPFLMLAVFGMRYALDRNRKSRQISEVLTLTDTLAHLIRYNPKGDTQEWECNVYWATPELHATKGPVPNYVTLRGMGREVEIGAFLSEEERMDLFDDLKRGFSRARGEAEPEDQSAR
jgi:uncharacterized membrane protein